MKNLLDYPQYTYIPLAKSFFTQQLLKNSNIFEIYPTLNFKRCPSPSEFQIEMTVIVLDMCQKAIAISKTINFLK